MQQAGQIVSQNLTRGLALTGLAFAMFTVQDAMVKWLVVVYSVPQVLFMRSVVIIAMALMLSGRQALPRLVASRNKGALVLRAALLLIAWLLYYTASRDLGLAQLSTIYFVAPIIVVALSALILHERVPLARWLIVILGFLGVLLASLPSASISLLPAAMALLAAFCWALNSILVRLISGSETTANQMLASNALFLIASAVTFPWVWQTPEAFDWMLMFALGLVGGLGQFWFFEGFRHAPASAIAPMEYTALVWAFLLGYLIWSDIPQVNVFAGAGLIAASSLWLLWSERQRAPA